MNKLLSRESSRYLGCKSLSSSTSQKIRFSWLDLRGSGLSVIERLCVEEALQRHDDRNWVIVGTHDATRHRYFSPLRGDCHCMIVMGIGGKPDRLLDLDLVKRDDIPVIKRFSGGGTVVVDHNSLWTTFIGRQDLLPSSIEPYPRPLMEWSATVFEPVFSAMKERQQQIGLPARSSIVVHSESCGPLNSSGRLVTLPPSEQDNTLFIPDFSLRENDYVLGERKMGGNAQSISKNGWLHHTSFLWDYDDQNMEYLSLPEKRPQYRMDRSHHEFLVKLKDVYPTLKPKDFFSTLRNVCNSEFELEVVTVPEALRLVASLGGFETWFEANRTRVVSDLS